MIDFSNNLQEVLKQCSSILKNKGITNSKKELEWFCKKSFNYSLIDIQLSNIFLSIKESQLLQTFIDRRSNHEPFQYIINSAPFLEYDFFVNPSVLIPRPETEIIFKILKNRFFQTALDIGTGSGNIAIALKLKKIAKSITAIDCVDESLKVAKFNAQSFNVKDIDFCKINIFKHKFNKRYDLAVSNPPYISKKDYYFLSEDIKNYEPQIALTDNEDGYNFYKYFAQNINLILKPKGTMILEIGLENTKNEIEKIFEKHANLTWHKDYNFDYRILELHV